MKIIKGKKSRPQKIVIYGTEGVGKTYLAAQCPAPLFIDCEGGTDQLDVARTERVVSYNQLLSYLQDIPAEFETVVIDTIDWAERYITDFVCTQGKKDSIEEFGYGKGYVLLKEQFQKFLDKLSEIATTKNVVLIAHSQIRKFELPDQQGAFDKYELKMTKHVTPVVKEWCDALLFMNWFTRVDIDSDTKKAKASGGKERVIYTAHSAAWDAKNRHWLADMIPATWEGIQPCFAAADAGDVPTVEKQTALEFSITDEPAVNEYLATKLQWIESGQTYRDLPADKVAKIAERKAAFLEKAGVGL